MRAKAVRLLIGIGLGIWLRATPKGAAMAFLYMSLLDVPGLPVIKIGPGGHNEDGIIAIQRTGVGKMPTAKFGVGLELRVYIKNLATPLAPQARRTTEYCCTAQHCQKVKTKAKMKPKDKAEGQTRRTKPKTKTETTRRRIIRRRPEKPNACLPQANQIRRELKAYEEAKY